MMTIKNGFSVYLTFSLISFFVLSCSIPQRQIIEVATFKGQQVTGVSVSHSGRIFANFPRWRETVEYSVVENKSNTENTPYPDKRWNGWHLGENVEDSLFLAVQSVVSDQNDLYVLDTRNALWKGVIDAPRIFVFDLQNDSLKDILILSDGSYKPNSYMNDLRVDHRTNAIYMTDSNEPALVVYDLKTRQSKRVLDKHYSTTAEMDHLMFGKKKWGSKPVNSDGIALNTHNNRLYYHSLTGYTLYSVSTVALCHGSSDEIESSVIKEAVTPAPDGMIFDANDNLYMADLENNKIVYLSANGKINTLCEGEKVKWADTFSIYDGYLYYTNSRIHEVSQDISDMVFSIHKIKLN